MDTVYKNRSGYSPGGRVDEHLFTRLLIRAFYDVEKPLLFSDLAALTAKSENKKGFTTSEKVRNTRLPC